MLTRDNAHAQIADNQLEEVSIRRILTDRLAAELAPDTGGGDARVVVDGANDQKVQLRVIINSVKERLITSSLAIIAAAFERMLRM
jgi:hypothetical protein